MSFKAVLFDHDGTLVDSERVHFELWNKALGQYGVAITEPFYIDELLGVPADENARIVIEKFGLNRSIAEMLVFKEELAHAFLNSSCFPAMPGSIDIVRDVAARVPCGIVSGSQKSFVASSIESHGWGDYLGVLVTADDVSHNKPAPDGYLKAAAALNVLPSECVVLEDTFTGMSAALAAGMAVIAIRNDFNHSHDFTAADVVVNSLDEAWTWLAPRLVE